MIPLTKTEFDMNMIDRFVQGAGILPVSVDDHGTIRFLLGKEKYISHWRGSLKWSGFEGGRKNGESVESTAAREFSEESLDTISTSDGINGKQNIVEFLRQKKYVTRIVLCILHGENVERRYHTTYIVQTRYDEKCSLNFAARRKRLLELQQLSAKLQTCTDALAENQNIPRENSIFHKTHIQSILNIHYVSNNALEIVFRDNKSEIHKQRITNLSDEEKIEYCHWHELRVQVTRELAITDYHEALVITRNIEGLVTYFRVHEDFLEKQNIQWWSISDLHTVMKNGGYMNAESFRAYFLPVLQCAMKELQDIVMLSSMNSLSLCAHCGE